MHFVRFSSFSVPPTDRLLLLLFCAWRGAVSWALFITPPGHLILRLRSQRSAEIDELCGIG
jgi:hypothetical protein